VREYRDAFGDNDIMLNDFIQEKKEIRTGIRMDKFER
jgi:hypothetical protein